MEALLQDKKCAYVRTGRNPVEDIYESDEACPFSMNHANILMEGTDAAIIACGEMVLPAYQAAKELGAEGIRAGVVDMYCIKPLDTATVLKVARQAKVVITVEEHSYFGGLGSMVAQVVSENCPRRVKCLALPDAPVITGSSQEVFDYYGLNAAGIAQTVREQLSIS